MVENPGSLNGGPICSSRRVRPHSEFFGQELCRANPSKSKIP